MKYDGCVIADALNMKAISADGGAGVKALLAGVDILLYPDDPMKLFEALVCAVSEGAVTDATVDRALARQNALVEKLAVSSAEPRDLSLVGCAGHRAFVREAAPSCLAWAFKNKPFTLKPGETVAYLEPLTSRPDWKGRAFVEELCRLGVRVEPFNGGATGKILIGSFSKPRAFSGDINLNENASAEIERALSVGGEIMMAAFGSPFVFDRFYLRLSAGLCAFCALEDFQRAAAAVLTGGVRAGGTMPVDLGLKG
jgi:hypothetical protein